MLSIKLLVIFMMLLFWDWNSICYSLTEEPGYVYRGQIFTSGVEGLPIKDIIKLAIESVRSCELVTTKNTPWQIVHGILAFGQTFEIIDGNSNQRVNAVEYLCDGANFCESYIGYNPWLEYKGYPVIMRKGEWETQGHEDQYLMYLSQAGVGLDHQITTSNGSKFTVRDLLAKSQLEVNASSILDWTLPAYVEYFPLVKKWRNKFGQKYSILDLLNIRCKSGLDYSTCGGTHSLYGLAWVVKKYEQCKIDHIALANARLILERSIYYARLYQNEDGSFTRHWRRYKEPPVSDSELLHYTGHMLEWLSVISPESEMDWIEKSAYIIAVTILKNIGEKQLHYGDLAHCVHGLRLFSMRRMGIGE